MRFLTAPPVMALLLAGALAQMAGSFAADDDRKLDEPIKETVELFQDTLL